MILLKLFLQTLKSMNKVVWEGWTVQHFIDDLEPLFNMIQTGKAITPKLTQTTLKKWLIDNQPYYKKHIPEVFKYFKAKL